jgi:hypothetical protein
MLALIQSADADEPAVLISADSEDRLKDQIKRAVHNDLSASAWYTIMDERETADLGKYQITVFDTNSIITLAVSARTMTTLDVQRNVHNLKVRD